MFAMETSSGRPGDRWRLFHAQAASRMNGATTASLRRTANCTKSCSRFVTKRLRYWTALPWPTLSRSNVSPKGLQHTAAIRPHFDKIRSEEHTSELQSLMRISYAVFCLKKKKKQN